MSEYLPCRDPECNGDASRIIPTDKDTQPSLTLRDYFAGQALAGLATNCKWGSNLRDMCRAAYRSADIMLELRQEDGDA